MTSLEIEVMDPMGTTVRMRRLISCRANRGFRHCEDINPFSRTAGPSAVGEKSGVALHPPPLTLQLISDHALHSIHSLSATLAVSCNNTISSI